MFQICHFCVTVSMCIFDGIITLKRQKMPDEQTVKVIAVHQT